MLANLLAVVGTLKGKSLQVSVLPCLCFFSNKSLIIMDKTIRIVFKNDNFLLSERTSGFYLWDYVKKYNVAMHEKTEQDALLYALVSYQTQLSEAKLQIKEYQDKIRNAFIALGATEDEDLRESTIEQLDI